MEKNADGKLAITRVELRPKITWSGDRRPSAEELEKIHHSAHENYFIANSVKTDVTVCLAERPRLRSLEAPQGLRGTALLQHTAAVRSWSRDSRRIGRRSPVISNPASGPVGMLV